MRAILTFGYVFASATAVAGAAASTPALAQGGQEPVGEIIVTAQKRSEQINDVAMSITAVSGDALIQRGVTSVADLARVVPGFSYAQSQFNAPVYIIRGMGLYETTLAAAPAVTVYTNEIPLPYPSMTRGAGLDLERVEVLKGPQGTLFGQNSTGGAINYVAARPTQDLSLGGSVSYSRFDTLDVQGFVSGPLSPTLAARVAVRAVSGGAWQHSLTRNDTTGEANELQGRASLEWKPTETATLLFTASGWRDKGDPQSPQVIAITPQVPARLPAFIANYPLAPEDARATDWDPGFDQRDDRFRQFAMRGDIELSEQVTLTSVTAHSRYRTRSDNNFDGLPVDNVQTTTRGLINAFYQELRLTGDMDGLRWVVGGNYGRDKIHDEQAVFSGFGSSVQPFPDLAPLSRSFNFTDQKVKTIAAFGNVEYDLTQQLTVQAGIRYTKVNRSFQGCATDAGDTALNAIYSRLESVFKGGVNVKGIPLGECFTLDAVTFDPGLVTGRLKEDNVSWRAGIKWQPQEDLLLYANLTKGYKAGGYPTVSNTSSVQYNPVTQESVLAYEGGAKLGLFNGGAQLNLAGFYYDYTNKQLRGRIRVPVFGVLSALLNIPKSRVYGAEVEFTARPLRGFNINLSGTYVNTRIKEFFGFDFFGVQRDLAGNEFNYTPKWYLQSDVEYEFPASNKLNLFVGGNTSYKGSTNASISGESITRVKDHMLVDLRAGVEAADGRWRAALWGKNVFNTFYWNNVIRASDTTVRYTGRPVTYGVTLSLRID